MQNLAMPSEFFLAANTPSGFFPVFDHLYYPEENWFCYILKGGPGTGKSTLMKKIAKAALEKGIETEIIRCSSDPQSLDAVIFPQLKKCIADGTAPHVLEPQYPGVCAQIVDLGRFWNTEVLQNQKEKIISLCKENSALHEKSSKFLSAYGQIKNDITTMVSRSIDYAKLNDYCSRFIKKIFKNKPKSGPEAKEQLRFISSVTPEGRIFLDKALLSLCEKIFIIDDPFDCVGNFILQRIREQILNLNYNFTASPSPTAPRGYIEALIIPEIKLGFVVKNIKINPTKSFEYIKINAHRFIKSEKISKQKNLLKLNNKISEELLRESVQNLNLAKKCHDEIEKLYITAMDYEKINKTADKLISTVFKK